VISRSIQRWQPILLLVAFIAFFSIPAFTWSSFKGPLEMCEVSALGVSIDVDGQPVEVEFPMEEPVEVEPGASVTITAEIEIEPEMCKGSFTFDWLLSLVSSPSRVKIASEAPTRKVLEITVGSRTSEALEEDHIILTVRDSSRRKREEATICLRIKGD
jgi:hypothetical protein